MEKRQRSDLAWKTLYALNVGRLLTPLDCKRQSQLWSLKIINQSLCSGEASASSIFWEVDKYWHCKEWKENTEKNVQERHRFANDNVQSLGITYLYLHTFSFFSQHIEWNLFSIIFIFQNSSLLFIWSERKVFKKHSPLEKKLFPLQSFSQLRNYRFFKYITLIWTLVDCCVSI